MRTASDFLKTPTVQPQPKVVFEAGDKSYSPFLKVCERMPNAKVLFNLTILKEKLALSCTFTQGGETVETNGFTFTSAKMTDHFGTEIPAADLPAFKDELSKLEGFAANEIFKLISVLQPMFFREVDTFEK